MGLTGGPWNLKRLSRSGPRPWSYGNVMGYFNESWVGGTLESHSSRVSYEISVWSKIAGGDVYISFLQISEPVPSFRATCCFISAGMALLGAGVNYFYALSKGYEDAFLGSLYTLTLTALLFYEVGLLLVGRGGFKTH